MDTQILKEQERIIARDYRNRRIGDFLKELHLTEGRGTEFPTIYKVMRKNSSPKPVFDTDEQCIYFLTTLPANVIDQVSDQASDQALSILNAFVYEKVAVILKIVKEPTKREEILEAIGLTNHTTNRKKYLDPLLDYGWVKM